MKTIFILILFLVCSLEGKKKKKDPRDYTDADLYKLEEQWAVSKFYHKMCKNWKIILWNYWYYKWITKHEHTF